MKTCSKCNVVKSFDEFSRNSSTPSGRRSNCKSCANEYTRVRNATPEQKVKRREWDRIQRNRPGVKARKDEQNKVRYSRPEVKAQITKQMKVLRDRYRQDCFGHYGWACACCDKTVERFLTIDHVGGGGNNHRKEIGGKNMYRWLVVNNFPAGFRTLCSSCNAGTHLNGGLVCPHVQVMPVSTNVTRNTLLNRTLKLEMQAAYGGKCACCSEMQPLLLCLDHVNNDGAQSRKTEAKEQLWNRLKQEGWPTGDYQLLCWNCNDSKSWNGRGICAHLDEGGDADTQSLVAVPSNCMVG